MWLEIIILMSRSFLLHFSHKHPFLLPGLSDDSQYSLNWNQETFLFIQRNQICNTFSNSQCTVIQDLLSILETVISVTSEGRLSDAAFLTGSLFSQHFKYFFPISPCLRNMLKALGISLPYYCDFSSLSVPIARELRRTWWNTLIFPSVDLLGPIPKSWFPNLERYFTQKTPVTIPIRIQKYLITGKTEYKKKTLKYHL